MSSALDNKLLAKRPFALEPAVIEQLPSEGLVPWQLVVEEHIGTEMVLIIVDPTSFVYELARVRPFNLFVKPGMGHTSYGPLMFLLFYVPDPRDESKMFAAWDYYVNPQDRGVVLVLRDLARQQYWHVILVGPKGEVVDLLEFRNVYGLGEATDQAVEVSRDLPLRNFHLAKEEFCQTHSLQDLFETQ